MRILKFTVPQSYDGSKLLGFLRGEANVSLRLLRNLKTVENGITRNGVHIRTVDKVRAGDVIEISIPEKGHAAEPVEIPIDIIYEDADLLVINKPAGLAMHPTHNHQGDTLANAVSWYLQDKQLSGSFRAVGRLDKGTSGVVVCALNPYTAAKLSGKLEKEYYALADALLEGSGVIEVPIYRPDAMKTLRACGETETAEYALTRWYAIKNDGRRTLVRVCPETGRTHQIRVHFAHIGAPLVGDYLYNEDFEKSGINHQLLHCRKVTLEHPVTGEKMSFEAPLPSDFDVLRD